MTAATSPSPSLKSRHGYSTHGRCLPRPVTYVLMRPGSFSRFGSKHTNLWFQGELRKALIPMVRICSLLSPSDWSCALPRYSDSARFTDAPEAGSKEINSSWALFIMIMLLMFALFTSYILQQRKIQAVHETVLSIFAGMCCDKAGRGCSV